MKNIFLASSILLAFVSSAVASEIACNRQDVFSKVLNKNFSVCLDDISGCPPEYVFKIGSTEDSSIHLACMPQLQHKEHVQQYTSSQLLQANAPTTITPQRIKEASFNWEAAGEKNAETLTGDDGSVEYPYGASQPVVACSPLHLCVVKLQEGETISNVALGDSVRWKVQAASAGKFPTLVIKPTRSDIKTNLTVMTDAGRIYYMTLVSYSNKWVPLISFYDPQKMVETVNHKSILDSKAAQAEADKTVATMPGEDITAMDFGFVSMGGSSDIKPVRVFASAGHTYIQMPDALKTKDAPAIFSLVNGEQQLVNFRVKGDYYIVDGVPEKMNLVLGAGNNTQIVNILHKQK